MKKKRRRMKRKRKTKCHLYFLLRQYPSHKLSN
jgi:hypothetical protein